MTIIQTNKKTKIIIFAIGVLLITSLILVFALLLKSDNITADELISANNFDKLLSKNNTIYIETVDQLGGRDYAYAEYNDGAANFCTSARNASSSWQTYLYNNYKFVVFSDGTLFSVCNKVQPNLSACDIFSSTMLILKHSNAKQSTLEKKDNGYELSYEITTNDNNKTDVIKYTFYFAKNYQCSSIEKLEKGTKTVTSFEYGVEKQYFDCLKNIDTKNTVEINITDVNSADYNTQKYVIPANTKFLIEHNKDATLYLDDGCTQVYDTEPFELPHIKSKVPVNENQNLYLCDKEMP